MSQYHYLTDEELLSALSTESRIIRAFEPDSKARFFVITCSADSTEVKDFVRRLNQVMPEGKSVNAYRQAQTNSIQIYLSFTQPVLTDAIRTRLVDAFGEDFTFHGQNELFVLPLQTGFAWLDDELAVTTDRSDLTFNEAVQRFLNDLELSAVDPGVLDLLTSPVHQSPEDSAEGDPISEASPLLSQTGAVEPQTRPVLALASLPHESNRVLPDSEDALPSIPTEGGHQLLLFDTLLKVERAELPKEIPKRGRRGEASAALSSPFNDVVELNLFPDTTKGAAGASKTIRRLIKEDY